MRYIDVKTLMLVRQWRRPSNGLDRTKFRSKFHVKMFNCYFLWNSLQFSRFWLNPLETKTTLEIAAKEEGAICEIRDHAPSVIVMFEFLFTYRHVSPPRSKINLAGQTCLPLGRSFRCRTTINPVSLLIPASMGPKQTSLCWILRDTAFIYGCLKCRGKKRGVEGSFDNPRSSADNWTKISLSVWVIKSDFVFFGPFPCNSFYPGGHSHSGFPLQSPHHFIKILSID